MSGGFSYDSRKDVRDYRSGCELTKRGHDWQYDEKNNKGICRKCGKELAI